MKCPFNCPQLLYDNMRISYCHAWIVCNLPILHWFVQCLVSMVKCVFWNSIYRPPARTHTLALCNPNRFNGSDFVYPLSLITHIELPTRLNFINWTRCSCSFRVCVCVCVCLAFIYWCINLHTLSIQLHCRPQFLHLVYHVYTIPIQHNVLQLKYMVLLGMSI